jgi:hypothetical protein
MNCAPLFGCEHVPLRRCIGGKGEGRGRRGRCGGRLNSGGRRWGRRVALCDGDDPVLVAFDRSGPVDDLSGSRERHMPVVRVTAIPRPEQLDDTDTALCHEGPDLLAVDRVDAACGNEIDCLAEPIEDWSSSI